MDSEDEHDFAKQGGEALDLGDNDFDDDDEDVDASDDDEQPEQ